MQTALRESIPEGCFCVLSDFSVVQALAQDVFPNTVAVQIVDQRTFAETERGIQRADTGAKVADAED